MKITAIIISALILGGCVNFGNNRERPERIITQTEFVYREIPEEFFDCPPPPVVLNEFIDSVQMEAEYNENLVLPLFLNNDRCYSSVERIYQFNEENKRLNENE